MNARTGVEAAIGYPLILASWTDENGPHGVETYMAARDRDAIVDRILAAGYTKPRVIETVVELEALPDRTIIREYDGFVNMRDGANWMLCLFAQTKPRPSLEIVMPATVLYEPIGATK